MIESRKRHSMSDLKRSFLSDLIFLLFTTTIAISSSDAAIGLSKRFIFRENLRNNGYFRFRKSPSEVAKPSKDGSLRLKEEPPKELFTTVGSSHVLTCQAQGSPPPKIHWLKNGSRLPQSLDDLMKSDLNSGRNGVLELSATISKLFLDCLSLKDAGQYTCVAETPYLKTIAHTNIKVDSDGGKSEAECLNKEPAALAAPPRIYMLTTTRLELIGSSALLFCRADGIPRPNIKWLGPDQVQVRFNSERHEVLSNGDLYLKNLRWEDMGTYTCVASNEFGQDKGQTFLYPTKEN